MYKPLPPKTTEEMMDIVSPANITCEECGDYVEDTIFAKAKHEKKHTKIKTKPLAGVTAETGLKKLLEGEL